jgi:hypothetical protein
MVVLTDILYLYILDKHTRMTNIKKKNSLFNNPNKIRW